MDDPRPRSGVFIRRPNPCLTFVKDRIDVQAITLLFGLYQGHRFLKGRQPPVAVAGVAVSIELVNIDFGPLKPHRLSRTRLLPGQAGVLVADELGSISLHQLKLIDNASAVLVPVPFVEALFSQHLLDIIP